MPHRVWGATLEEQLLHPNRNLVLNQIGANHSPHRVLRQSTRFICQSTSVTP